MAPGRPFSSLRGNPDEGHEEVREVPIGFGSDVGTSADEIAERNEKLDQQCYRIGFGVRLDKPHEVARDTVERGLVQWSWPGAGACRGVRVKRQKRGNRGKLKPFV